MRDKYQNFMILPRGYNTIFMLNSTEYEISTAHNNLNTNSRGTKVAKMLTLAAERYTAGFCMVAKVILWCI